jgi:hypothetical protein
MSSSWDNHMFFDTRDNAVSPATVRKNIRAKMNTPEYRRA